MQYDQLSQQQLSVLFGSQMADDDVVRERIRDKLRADKVKLWLPPFTTDTGLKGEHPGVSWKLERGHVENFTGCLTSGLAVQKIVVHLCYDYVNCDCICIVFTARQHS